MKITKLEHSGIAVEENGKIVVIDPVEFDNELPALNNVIAIIITHKHSDHFQPEVIKRILETNAGVKVFTTAENAVAIDSANTAKEGDVVDVDGFRFEFFGKDHAAIIPGQVPCENIGVLINRTLMMPGDSFDSLGTSPKALCVPSAGPWCKVCESIEYIKAVRPEVVVPIHDAVLSELGKGFNNNWLNGACDEAGARFKNIGFNETIEI